MYWDDTGQPILDETDDAYSVYYVEAWQSGASKAADRSGQRVVVRFGSPEVVRSSPGCILSCILPAQLFGTMRQPRQIEAA
jgi:hypothetical protein